MKTISLIIVSSALVFGLASCGNSGPANTTEDFKIIRLRSVGEHSPNPVNLSHCLLPGSKETLESFRHVSKGRLFYMDYDIDFPFEDLIPEKKEERLAPNDYPTLMYKFNSALYGDTVKGSETSYGTGACSGFVCHNAEGQLLFGRNMDSQCGNLIVTFHRKQTDGYKFVFMTNQYYLDLLNGTTGPEYKADGIFMDRRTDLSLALRQPLFALDGMNEHGLCFAAYQLPDFMPDIAQENPNMPMPVNQNTPGSKGQIEYSTLVYLILSKCRTVSDVEEMMSKYDYVTMMNKLNTHWYVADAEGDYAVFEYWGRGTEESPYKLYVMRRDERFRKTGNHTYYGVPYEYNSIENYYCNPEAAFTYNQDKWQFNFSNKVRVHHMMSAYKPVMTEKEALICLQEGSFGIEEPDDVTNWSCIYNPAERTMLFNMRNDLSEVYSIDLKEDL